MTTTATNRVDLQTAADELGVHYQTAYRWVRSGRLPSHLVNGRYVVERADLVEVDRSRSVPRPPTPPSATRLDRAARRLTSALVEGDEPTARKLVSGLADDGTPMVDLLEQVLVPPLRTIGERWHDGELSIWVEHRSSAIVERILGDIAPNPRGRRRGTAVVAAVSGDHHSLPTTMAAVALRADQWHVHHLGADVPADQIAECCADNRADLVVITVTRPEVADEAHALADVLRRDGTTALIGAPGRRLDDLLSAARAAVPTSPSER